MFTTKEAIKELTGVDIAPETLPIAQMMVEAWIGKNDMDVTDGTDRATLGRAVTFQALYIDKMHLDMLEQAAATKVTMGESTTTFDTALFAPYMSPWAVMTCRKLSWMGTRSVSTGPVFDQTRYQRSWERD